jgi:hypothetical protein
VLRDQLASNESMKLGDSKISNGGKSRLTLQPTGNLELWQMNPSKLLWASNTAGKGTADAFMGWDGNLAVRDSTGNHLWDNKVSGYKNTHAIIQDDGNLVIYKDNKTNSDSVVWESHTAKFVPGSLVGAGMSHDMHTHGIGKFLSNAVKTVGKPFAVVGEGLQDVDGAVSGLIKKIPVLGKPLAAAFDLGFTVSFGPAMAVGQIADGKRIDKAVLGQFKQELQDVKEVAPYVEMVMSFIPGIGTGISAMLAAGVALASGQPISVAIDDSMVAAVPGGAIAKAAYNVAKGGINLALSGKKVTWQALADIGVQGISDLASLPPVAKDAMLGTIDTAGQLIKGAKIDIAVGDGLADTSSAYIGKAGANALKVGVAVTHAKFLQGAQSSQITSPTLKNKMMAMGQVKLQSDPVVAASRSNVAPASLNGFDIGVGFSSYGADANQLVTFRDSLNADEQQGFDHAMSLNIGRVANPPPSNYGLTTPNGQAGFYSTMGMQGADTNTKQKMMTNIVAHPVSKIGASVAVDKITWARMGIFGQFWEWLKSVF